MSGEGNPNHDPSTGQFASGGGSSGPKSKVGKTPRKLRTAKRSTQPKRRVTTTGPVGKQGFYEYGPDRSGEDKTPEGKRGMQPQTPSPKYASPKYLAQMANASDAREPGKPGHGPTAKPTGPKATRRSQRTAARNDAHAKAVTAAQPASPAANAAKVNAAATGDTSPVVRSGDKPQPQRRVATTGPVGKQGFYEYGPDKKTKPTPEGRRGLDPAAVPRDQRTTGLPAAEKKMRDVARHNGYEGKIENLKVDVTDKGVVLYDPKSNEVVVSLRDGETKPDYIGHPRRPIAGESLADVSAGSPQRDDK